MPAAALTLTSIEPSVNEDPWEQALVKDAEQREYRLARQENSGRLQPPGRASGTQEPLNRLHHSTLARTYIANLAKGRGGPRSFFLKLPDLRGVENTRDGDRRLCEARRQFEHEYYLHNSFFSTHPTFLPELLSKDGVELEARDDMGRLLKLFPSGTRIPYVASQSLPGRSVREWLSERFPNGFNGIPSLHEWLDIAEKLFYGLEVLHRERLAHGFISPDNILVSRQLGKAEFKLDRQYLPQRPEVTPAKQFFWFINAAEPQPVMYLKQDASIEDQKFPIRRWYDAPENLYYFDGRPLNQWLRFELDQGSDYYSTTDIFSLGVTLAFLATGQEDIVRPFDYAEPTKLFGWQRVRLKDRKRLQAMKVELFDALLAAAAARGKTKPANLSLETYKDCICRLEVILQCVRSRPDRRARSVKHVEAVSSYFGRVMAPLGRATPEPASAHLRLPDAGHILGDSVSRSVVEVANSYVIRAEEAIDSLREDPRSLRVTGSRASLVDAFLTAMSAVDTSVGSRQACIALTSPAIWMDENFGPTSRTSSMLNLLRISGVRVEWVIVVTDEDLYRSEVQRVFGFRKSDDELVSRVRKEPETARNGGFSYLPVARDQYEDIFRKKESFIGILKETRLQAIEREIEAKDDQENELQHAGLDLLIAPDFTSRRGHMAALTFWPEPIRGKALVTKFLQRLGNARRVTAFDRFL